MWWWWHQMNTHTPYGSWIMHGFTGSKSPRSVNFALQLFGFKCCRSLYTTTTLMAMQIKTDAEHCQYSGTKYHGLIYRGKYTNSHFNGHSRFIQFSWFPLKKFQGFHSSSKMKFHDYAITMLGNVPDHLKSTPPPTPGPYHWKIESKTKQDQSLMQLTNL